MKKYEEIKNLISLMETDVNKFNNGNNAAGTRVRKALQDIKRAAQEFRNEVQVIKNGTKG